MTGRETGKKAVVAAAVWDRLGTMRKERLKKEKIQKAIGR